MLLGLIRELLMEVSQPLMLLLKVVLLVKNSDVMVQLDAYCSAIVKKIKDCYGWNGEVKFEPSVGAWIGEFPLYLRYNHEADPIDQDITGSPEVSTTNKEELATTVQEIASYQIVLSPEGKIDVDSYCSF